MHKEGEIEEDLANRTACERLNCKLLLDFSQPRILIKLKGIEPYKTGMFY